LRDFGEKILFEENFEELVERLDGIMSREEIRQYNNYLVLMVFHDITVEESGGGAEGMLQAAQTLKGIAAMTANFGARY